MATSQQDVDRIIKCHAKWREKIEGGERADFRGLHLVDMCLKGADLERAIFARATLERVDFTKAQLESVDFSDAKLIACNFRDASLLHANFRNADLRGSREVIARECDFTRANLSGLKGAVFDDCRIGECVLSRSTDEAWLNLVRKYTASRFVFTLILLAIFFAPFAAKALMLSALSAAQGNPLVDAQMQALCARSGCRTTTLLAVLLGYYEVHPVLGRLGWVLGLIMITYNVLRALLTHRVTALADIGQTDLRTPPSWPRQRLTGLNSAKSFASEFVMSSGWLVRAGRIVDVLAIVAAGAFVLNLLQWLPKEVRVVG